MWKPAEESFTCFFILRCQLSRKEFDLVLVEYCLGDTEISQRVSSCVAKVRRKWRAPIPDSPWQTIWTLEREIKYALKKKRGLHFIFNFKSFRLFSIGITRSFQDQLSLGGIFFGSLSVVIIWQSSLYVGVLFSIACDDFSCSPCGFVYIMFTRICSLLVLRYYFIYLLKRKILISPYHSFLIYVFHDLSTRTMNMRQLK